MRCNIICGGSQNFMELTLLNPWPLMSPCDCTLQLQCSASHEGMHFSGWGVWIGQPPWKPRPCPRAPASVCQPFGCSGLSRARRRRGWRYIIWVLGGPPWHQQKSLNRKLTKKKLFKDPQSISYYLTTEPWTQSFINTHLWGIKVGIVDTDVFQRCQQCHQTFIMDYITR